MRVLTDAEMHRNRATLAGDLWWKLREHQDPHSIRDAYDEVKTVALTLPPEVRLGAGGTIERG